MNGELTVETEDGEQYIGDIKDMEVEVEKEFPTSEGQHYVNVKVGEMFQASSEPTAYDVIEDVEESTGPLGNNMRLLIKNLIERLDRRYK